MRPLFFGSFEEILYKYTKSGATAYSQASSEADFIYLLLSLGDKEECGETLPAANATRFKQGERSIAENFVRLFHRPLAREKLIDLFRYIIIPEINKVMIREMIEEYRDLVQQDKTISKTAKEPLLELATENSVSEFLTELLIYAVHVNIEDKKKNVFSVATQSLPRQNDWFIGRSDILKDIKRGYKKGNKIQILYGIGGIGKSQIACQYAYNNYLSFSEVHWVKAHTVNTILDGYSHFLKAKGLLSEQDNNDAILKKYKTYMEEKTGWLIIYDNCNFYTNEEYNEFLERYLPKKSPHSGCILITTRNKRQVENATRIDVGELTETESVDFLIKRTGQNDKAQAQILAKRLSYYPLALEIAGAYISATPGCNYQKYLSYLDTGVKVLDRAVEVTSYNQTIKEILLLTLKRIKLDRKNDIISLCAEFILHFSSYAAPYDIDLAIFSDIPKKIALTDRMVKILAAVENTCKNELDRNELAQILVRYSLFKEQKNGLLSLHEIHQAVVSDDIFEKMIGFGGPLKSIIGIFKKTRTSDFYAHFICRT